MPRLISPLRYPGSKVVLADYFENLLRESLLEGCTFYEPYAGGASMSLALLGRDAIAKAVLIERDPLLYAFWRCVVEQPDDLCDAVYRVSVDLNTWKKFQRYLSPNALREYGILKLGVAGLFLNRTNFSGIIAAKPIGGMRQQSDYTIDCRFNKDRLVGLIRDVAKYRNRIDVGFGDAIKYLARNAKKISKASDFVYVDPPYYQQGRKLYRYHYNLKQHQALASFMDRQPFSWIVSIDNHEDIREMYRNQKIIPIFLNYVVKQNRRAEELLISNMRLTPPVYKCSDGTVIEFDVANAL